MIKFSGLSRVASVALIAGGMMLAASAKAQEVPAEHLQAARAAITALGVTNRFDNILPNIMDRLTAQLIQAYPNLQDEISKKIEDEALKLAPRRADLEREAALVYAKAFTVDELKAITDFYSSDAGKKLLKDGPIATRELLKAADIWTTGVARDLEKQTNDALLKEVGGQAPAEAPKQ
ncbi:DUF2059 domain-containing protein [Rhizobium cremeum]|uniref:DUF2059 domain-containing protein n=1 Tax=Rhizobium cremeum TaxID=2813827 RepID=UPI000DDB1405|nr:DUF2059 domain-containing protein [Rhizobium cremeum]MCJ7993156.1 DUF2059 domain-containing protein [Rhizobium cremeum]MCJ7998221.1 DUF2059 domain-containing protein [Rhizobium cremeum]